MAREMKILFGLIILSLISSQFGECRNFFRQQNGENFIRKNSYIAFSYFHIRGVLKVLFLHIAM